MDPSAAAANIEEDFTERIDWEEEYNPDGNNSDDSSIEGSENGSNYDEEELSAMVEMFGDSLDVDLYE
jgi:hypothetical protein